MQAKNFRVELAVLMLLLLSGCSSVKQLFGPVTAWMDSLPSLDVPGLNWFAGDDEIRADELKAHIEVLASNEFAGRQPGSEGGRLTLAYLEDQYRRIGLKPLGVDDDFRQEVPLVGLRAQADIGLAVAGKPYELRLKDDLVLSSPRLEEIVRVRQSPVVFVGYGIQAPEYAWDDFKGRDMRGKTLLMLVNDPPVEDPLRPGQLDPYSFKGRAMTYYGRWTYKYDIAAKLGAAAVLVIHEPKAAGYPWSVVADHSGREHFSLDTPGANADQLAVQGWIRDEAVSALLAKAGLDFEQLKRQSASADFEPVALPALASFNLRQEIRRFRSANVAGHVPGEVYPDEWLLYLAHWDHLGRNETLEGDQIFNGAVDNASGVAGLLEIAHSFVARPASRSIMFLALTAEEQGLLGAQYYAEQPLQPLSQTLAVFNLDGLNPWGATRDITVIGHGQNSLEDALAQQAVAQERVVRPEASPEKGYYFRSDHFEFSRRGVPGLFVSRGIDFVGESADRAQEKSREYVRRDYHKVSDELDETWDLSGAVQDLQLLEATGRQVAADTNWPAWKAGSEFAGLRPERHP